MTTNSNHILKLHVFVIVLLQIIYYLVNLNHSDHITQMITLSVITLGSFHCSMNGH